MNQLQYADLQLCWSNEVLYLDKLQNQTSQSEISPELKNLKTILNPIGKLGSVDKCTHL